MSKELEALNGLAQFIIINDIGTDESASAIEWHGIIKKALERAKKDEELLELYRNLSMETDVFERSKYWEQINKIELEEMK
jgi:hypothetical protein